MSGKQTAYVVTCPRCDTRNAVRTSDSGKEVRCEMCHTRFVAPPLVEKRPTPAGGHNRGNFTGYGVSGSDPGTATKKSPKLREFAVECSLCSTRMTFREDQVGKQARCPDCYTQLVVPPAPPLPTKAKTTTETYAVSSEEPPERPGGDKSPAGYAFITRRSQAGPLFSADEVEGTSSGADDRPAGTDPGHPRGAQRPGAAPRQDNLLAGNWGAPGESSTNVRRTGRWKNEVAPSGPAAGAPADAHAHTRKPERKRTPEPEEHKLSRAQKNAQRMEAKREGSAAIDDPRADTPAHVPSLPMLSDIYNVPIQSAAAIFRWFVLTFLFEIVATAMGLTVILVAKMPPAIFYMIPIIVLFGLLAGGYAAGCMRAIVVDTANGAREIHDWNDWDMRNWLFSFFQFLIPALLVFSLGMFAAKSLPIPEDAVLYVALGITAIIFPWNYLSVIEENSNLVVISPLVARSFVSSPFAWLSFHVQTGLMLGGCIAAYQAIEAVTSTMTALQIIAPVTAAATFIWARLAGRLLWVAGQAELASDNAG